MFQKQKLIKVVLLSLKIPFCVLLICCPLLFWNLRDFLDSKNQFLIQKTSFNQFLLYSYFQLSSTDFPHPSVRPATEWKKSRRIKRRNPITDPKFRQKKRRNPKFRRRNPFAKDLRRIIAKVGSSFRWRTFRWTSCRRSPTTTYDFRRRPPRLR